MKTYRVGGCVRDQLLDLPVTDVDWVVTGASPGQLLDAGYQLIGKDFPVFLHPESKQEYALARSERKTAPGYHGFEFDTNSEITIEQDLLRRDLTINAMAQDEGGNIIDPYGGQQDLDARLLRHVSPAFCEDPVRVLRVARFAARFHQVGFRLAEETVELIRQMGISGELNALIAERVWSEMTRALDESDPAVFFQTLRQCAVLDILFPEIDELFGVPQTARYHPEIDTGVHVMMALQKSAELGFDNPTRFAVLMHDLGKATTPADILPGHQGHEERGVKLVKQFCKRWKIPKAHTELALVTTEFHTLVHRAFELKPTTILKLFRKVDIFRKPERFDKMLDACLADVRGRTGFEDAEYAQANFLRGLSNQLVHADNSALKQRQLQGQAMAEAIRELHLNIIKCEKSSLPESI